MLVTRRLRLLLLIKFKGEEVMSILIDETTPIIVQGYTGDKATFHADEMIKYGSNVVGGVTPGKGGG